MTLLKRQNPIARELADPKWRKRIVKPKKGRRSYSRKGRMLPLAAALACLSGCAPPGYHYGTWWDGDPFALHANNSGPPVGWIDTSTGRPVRPTPPTPAMRAANARISACVDANPGFVQSYSGQLYELCSGAVNGPPGPFWAYQAAPFVGPPSSVLGVSSDPPIQTEPFRTW